MLKVISSAGDPLVILGLCLRAAFPVDLQQHLPLPASLDRSDRVEARSGSSPKPRG